MGLSSFPSPSEGVLPMLVMNTVLYVSLLKNMVRSVLHMLSVSVEETSSNLDEAYSSFEYIQPLPPRTRRRISTIRYEALRKTIYNEKEVSICRSSKKGKSEDENSKTNKWSLMECCVCLNRFKGNEEVSELSCKHFFHKGCLEKWFDNHHTTCPLCRSIL